MRQTYNEKCKALGCPHYVEWSYYGSSLFSCKLQGESDNIMVIANDCPHRAELKDGNHE